MDTSLDATAILAQFNIPCIRQRHLDPPANCRAIETGTGATVFADAKGVLVFALYKSGLAVRRNKNGVTVRFEDGTYWFGDNDGHWFRID
jgi:hypothetical protein